jgi:predicted metal-dependent hydrolase
MKAFYGKEIDPASEQELIEKILAKYRHLTVSEELKKNIHSELAAAKSRGEISIPFKVVMRKDSSGKHRDYIEVILDTKV